MVFGDYKLRGNTEAFLLPAVSLKILHFFKPKDPIDMAASNNNRYSQEFVFSEEDDYSLDESEIETNLIDETNKLLSATGIVAKKIMSVAELARVSSSIFVAIFESVYHTRIEEVLRNPVTRSDYEYNAQLVIERLSEQINSDLSHITGSLIVNGDMTALKNLVNIFTRILSFTRYVQRLLPPLLTAYRCACSHCSSQPRNPQH